MPKETNLNLFVVVEIPSIIVDNTPTTPPSTTREIGGSPLSIYGDPETPSPSNRDSRGPDFGNIRPRPGGLQRRNRAEVSSAEFSPNNRDTLSMTNVSASTDADDILFSMQNSVWGGESLCSRAIDALLMLSPDMLVEAAEEDEKL